jgi:hypothetical protein
VTSTDILLYALGRDKLLNEVISLRGSESDSHAYFVDCTQLHPQQRTNFDNELSYGCIYPLLLSNSINETCIESHKSMYEGTTIQINGHVDFNVCRRAPTIFQWGRGLTVRLYIIYV